MAFNYDWSQWNLLKIKNMFKFRDCQLKNILIEKESLLSQNFFLKNNFFQMFHAFQKLEYKQK